MDMLGLRFADLDDTAVKRVADRLVAAGFEKGLSGLKGTGRHKLEEEFWSPEVDGDSLLLGCCSLPLHSDNLEKKHKIHLENILTD